MELLFGHVLMSKPTATIELLIWDQALEVVMVVVEVTLQYMILSSLSSLY
jgi:hypothetical protein